MVDWDNSETECVEQQVETRHQAVAVGILFNRDNAILLTQRQKHQSYSDYWEFPGGKVEPGETPLAALIREFKEEIDVLPLKAHPFMSVSYTYPTLTVRLSVFWAREFIGEPFGKEGQDLRWCQLCELKTLKLLPANDVILQGLMDLELLLA